MRKVNAEDGIRLFGMSGLLLRDELRKVQKEVGHNILAEDAASDSSSASDHDADYYPQFDKKVRDDAAAMSRHYEVFFCLERSIRQLVTSRMVEAKDPRWWDTCVP